MNKYITIFGVCITFVTLVITGCNPHTSNKRALECQELIQGEWGFGKNAFGYEIENPSNTRYKLVVDKTGGLFILDIYNNRVAKFDPIGQPEFYITLAQFPQERIVDIAPATDGHLFAAISSPVTIRSDKVNAYVAIYEFDARGQFWLRSVDWRNSEMIEQRLTVRLNSHSPFHYLVAAPDKSVYSMWPTGEIIQHTPEGLSRLIYNHPWGEVVAGWDGLVYVVGTWSGKDWLLIYEPLNGTLVRRVLINDFQAVKDGASLGTLVGVDAAGRLYFGATDLSMSTQLESNVYVLSSNGQLEERMTIPGRLAAINAQGQLYVFAFLKQDIPSGDFLVEKCGFSQ